MKIKFRIKKAKPTTIEPTYIAESVLHKIEEQEAMDPGVGGWFYEDRSYAYDARQDEPKPLYFRV